MPRAATSGRARPVPPAGRPIRSDPRPAEDDPPIGGGAEVVHHRAASVMHSPPVQPISSNRSGTGSVRTMWEEATVRRLRSGAPGFRGPADRDHSGTSPHEPPRRDLDAGGRTRQPHTGERSKIWTPGRSNDRAGRAPAAPAAPLPRPGRRRRRERRVRRNARRPRPATAAGPRPLPRLATSGQSFTHVRSCAAAVDTCR